MNFNFTWILNKTKTLARLSNSTTSFFLNSVFVKKNEKNRNYNIKKKCNFRLKDYKIYNMIVSFGIDFHKLELQKWSYFVHAYLCFEKSKIVI